VRFIKERLEHYKNEVLSALDRNESTEALKNRAVQKELEELLRIIKTRDVIDLSEYYSNKEAAKICGMSAANMTRYVKKLGAREIGRQWYFLKSVINNEAKNRNKEEQGEAKRSK
jgi:predicted nucleotidyltransferase